MPPIREIRVTCHAEASRLALALCEGRLAQVDPCFPDSKNPARPRYLCPKLGQYISE